MKSVYTPALCSETDVFVINFANPDLTAFLNLLAYRNSGPDNYVTLLVERQNNSSVSWFPGFQIFS